MSLPKTVLHANPGEELVPLLNSLLPYSVAILRRIQFHYQSPYRAVISTIDPANPPVVTRQPAAPTSSSPDTPPWESATLPVVSAPFAVFFIDRSRYKETESWLFSTADLPTLPSTQSYNGYDRNAGPGHDRDAFDAIHRAHMLATLAHGVRFSRGLQHADLAAAAVRHEDPSALIVGSLHRRSLRLLVGKAEWDARDPAVEYGIEATSDRDAVERSKKSAGGVVRGHTIAYIKYIFPPKGLPTADGDGSVVAATGTKADPPPAPEGLCWVQHFSAEDYHTIVNSTHIPRTAETLAMLPSRALREAAGNDTVNGDSKEDGKLAAWAFITPDGSFGALYVQPEHRGRGVARTLIAGLRGAAATAVVKGRDGQQTAAFADLGEETAWGASDTAEANTAAQKTLEAGGGIRGWLCYWGFFDLDVVEREAKALTETS